MHDIGRNLWHDEQGLVISAELVFVASIVAIGMIVGLSAYRDGVIEELADAGRAVGQFNQSYAVEIADNGGDITVAGDVVTITKTYGVAPNQVLVVTTFNNFSYNDTADFCEAGTLQRTSAAAVTEATPAPAPAVP